MEAGESVRDRLIRRVDEVLGGSLGLNVLGIPVPREPSNGRVRQPDAPLLAGAAVALLYALAFIGLPLAIHTLRAGWPEQGDPLWALFILQLYGAFWCGTSTALTFWTSPSILAIIEAELVPYLSEESLGRLLEKLGHAAYRRKVQLCVAWAIGIAAAAVAGMLVHADLPRHGQGLWRWDLLWWSAGWAVLYATAARVVLTSRLCMLFGDVLSDEPERLSPLNPGQSPLVASLLALTKRMLIFWTAMAATIALVIPFGLVAWAHPWPAGWADALPGAGGVGRLHPSSFGFILVHFIATSILSIGGGTLILLKSEAAARGAARRATNAMLRRLDAEAMSIASGVLDEEGVKRLAGLKALQSDIAAQGSYRSLVVAAASVLLPFVPLIAVLLKIPGR